MIRCLIACLMTGVFGLSGIAAEAASPSATQRFVAKVKCLRVDRGQQTAFATEVAGTKGKPVKAALDGKHGLTLNLAVEYVADTAPSQYRLQFQWIETRDGKPVMLSAPTLVTTVGAPAKLMVGQERGDRIEVETTINEAAP